MPYFRFLKSVLWNVGQRPHGSTIDASSAFLALGRRAGCEVVSADA
jgi:hypothetical protein